LNVELLHFTAPLKHDMVLYTLMIRGYDLLDIPEQGPFLTLAAPTDREAGASVDHRNNPL
jgi:hypothetical protein